MIKPIETFYGGYKFRSRLEARWAVFFDALEISWEYEKEGFVLGEGTFYLPDFWLPEFNSWVEVKANDFSLSERAKCELFAKEYSIVLVSGLPEPNYYEQLYWDAHPTWSEETGFVFDSETGILLEDAPTLMSMAFRFEEKLFNKLWEEFDDAKYAMYESAKALSNACDKSKQARFEHGERG